MADARTDPRRTLEAYAALVRVPNLFTAPPDVILGAALVTAAGFAVDLPAIAGLAVASILLYAAGTTLNDAFDAPVDAEERPERPIPSGRISRTAAFAFGGILLVAGVAVAGAAAGFAGGAVAAALAAVIVLYDGLLKDSAAGFLAMGTTRGLNVLLGTTIVGLPTRLPIPVWFAVAVVTVYIAAVTYMAAGETEVGGRTAVAVAGGAALLAAVAAAGYLLAMWPGAVPVGLGIALALAFLWWVGRPLWRAYTDPEPGTIGPAVGACVLGLVLLDAAFAAVAGVAWALAVAVFLVPAVGLSRVFEVS